MRRWTRWLLFLVLAARVCKIIFLGNLDIGKQSSILATWKSNFYELSLPFEKTNSLGRAGLYFDEVAVVARLKPWKILFATAFNRRPDRQHAIAIWCLVILYSEMMCGEYL